MQPANTPQSLPRQNPEQLPSFDCIEAYFNDFERWAKAENWDIILEKGKAALDVAVKTNRKGDEAKICAQLTSTTFYKGDYPQALTYAKRCRELSAEFVDPTLHIRSLYLESAAHRALKAFAQAVEIGELAAETYSANKIENCGLRGKVYFNLGAAHADNPQGDLGLAAKCYEIALGCFKLANASEDVARTTLRLGKVKLLGKQYTECETLLAEARALIANERLTMHADYLEAQLRLALNDRGSALIVARKGLERATVLGAKEDQTRLEFLLKNM